MIGWLISNAAPYAIALGALFAALLGYGAQQKAKGRKQARQQAKEADDEHAADIHNRVERDLPDIVRQYDDAGYRD